MSKSTTLGDLASSGLVELNDGYRTRADELGTPGVPILRVAEVLDGRIAPTFVDHVHEDFRPKFKGKCSQPGDVVVTTKGTVGRVALISSADPEFVYSPQVCFFRINDQSEVDPRFLYHWFRGGEFTTQSLGIQSQTDMAPYINLADMRSITITVPPIAEQRAIAGVLGALDDKIDSNRRLAKSGAELIRSEVDGVSTDQWSPAAVSSLASFVNGGAFTKDASGIGRPVLRIADLKSGVTASTIRNDIDVPDVNIARAGDVLMAWSGSLDVYRWAGPESIINQHIFKVIPNKFPSWFVFDRLQRAMPEFQQIAADKATTMGHIKRHHLDDVETFVPSRSDLAELSERLEPIWDRTLAAEVEIHSLSSLRDALLPELLSGRLRVRDAESFLEDEL